MICRDIKQAIKVRYWSQIATSPLRPNIQPRSQALPSCGGKTLAVAGHVSRGFLVVN
jgi:hypothetical protein